jgi:hypothetical protein
MGKEAKTKSVAKPSVAPPSGKAVFHVLYGVKWRQELIGDGIAGIGGLNERRHLGGGRLQDDQKRKETT